MVFKPLASVGKPYSTENYNLECVDGTDVYVMKGIRAINDTVEISATSFLFIENLVVEGIIV